MAPALNTIPDAPADEAAPLTAAPQSKTSIKGLVAGAAVASFILGLMAATAVTSAAAPRAPAAFSVRHSSVQLQTEGRCLTARTHKEKAFVDIKPCGYYPDSQSWDINGDQIRLSGTSLCLDGLGGSLFNTGRHDKFGLYDCKDSVNQKFSWENGGLALSTPLNLKHPGVLCVETRGNDVVPAEKAKVSCQSWEITDGPTPAPPPTPRPATPTFKNCPWNYDKQCTNDSDCVSPGFNDCQKCHIGSGSTMNICGPKSAPPPTPSPAGKGKCNTQLSPKSQGARSCNPKYNEEDFPYYNRECSGNGKCSTCRKSTTSKHFNGHNWSGYCMDPNDE